MSDRYASEQFQGGCLAKIDDVSVQIALLDREYKQRKVGDRCLPYRTVAMYSVRHAEESREINPAQSSVTR
ncbi:hypothetical protein OUZ56_001977 [Daphnia magna]|uniref:Uncharacterized protein n=1 Tax=Daphnia magna TaxID=35525 RepID=A0ABR0A4B1_9CRUS|nr:hypothetical protein OUZ56_001977 [Daphnia magna]